MNQQKTLICVAVGIASIDEALEIAHEEQQGADIIEIRLDMLSEPAIKPFVEKISAPLLFTYRPDWEGGNFTGRETERLETLLEAASGGASFIDCELRAPAETKAALLAHTAESGCCLILSYHDFEKTPDQATLENIVLQMQQYDGAIGKIVTTAADYLDVLRVLKLQEQAADLNFPLIGFCMGDPGRISRVATARLGGFMTYCAPRANQGTASGQLSAEQLQQLLAQL
ncbi:MAG: type I 3-dehydroquinate dehydratase [Desulfobulbaceae bacterium]|nr:MAG: type I 3-dehydroquinate dehydratase [Desulfobulbaceae bacterium]